MSGPTVEEVVNDIPQDRPHTKEPTDDENDQDYV